MRLSPEQMRAAGEAVTSFMDTLGYRLLCAKVEEAAARLADEVRYMSLPIEPQAVAYKNGECSGARHVLLMLAEIKAEGIQAAKQERNEI